MKLKEIQQIVTDATNNKNWSASEWRKSGKNRIYVNFKGRSQGFITVKDGKIAEVNVDHQPLQNVLDKLVGQDYQFAGDDEKNDQTLPQLTGTEKQVTWASELRADFLDRTQARVPKTEEGQKAIQLTIAAISEHKDAAWWIDNRSNIDKAINATYQNKLKDAREKGLV